MEKIHTAQILMTSGLPPEERGKPTITSTISLVLSVCLALSLLWSIVGGISTIFLLVFRKDAYGKKILYFLAFSGPVFVLLTAVSYLIFGFFTG